MAPGQAQPEDKPRPRLQVEESGEGDARELALVKNGQRYVFRCAPGEEPVLLRRLGEMVRDPKVDIDWFDAAVLSHQIGQRMGSQLQRMHRRRA
jgi:hypothetical protein